MGLLVNPPWGRAVKALVVAAYLTPSIPLFSGLPAIRLEELILVFMFCWVLLRVVTGEKTPLILGARQLLLALFSIVVLLSMLTGAFLGFSTSYGDFAQLIRLAKYIGVYTVALNAIYLSDEPTRVSQEIRKWILLSGCCLTVITLQQYFDLFGLNSLYVQFVAPTQYETLLPGSLAARPVGMVGNPNELGFLLATAAVIAFYEFIVAEAPRIPSVAAAGFLLIGLALTQSRTAMVYTVVAVGLLGGLTFTKTRGLNYRRLWRFLIPVVLTGIGLSVALANNEIFRAIGWRYLEALDLDSSTSWQSRLLNWEENLRLFEASPLVGVGPLRTAEFKYAADNEWLLLLRSYGIAGTIYLVGVLVIPFFLRRGNTPRNRDLFVLVSGVLIGSAVFMIPAVVFHSLALMPVVLIIVAMDDTTWRAWSVRS